MRYRIIPFVVLSGLFALIIGSCSQPTIYEEPDPIVFEFRDTIDMTLPSAIGIDIPIDLPDLTVSSSFHDTVGDVNPLVSLVEDIHVKEIQVELISPSDETWDFLKHMTLFVSTDTEPEIELGHVFNNPNGTGKIITLEAAYDNRLDDYVKAPYFNVDTEVTVDELLLTKVQVRAYLVLDVTLINY